MINNPGSEKPKKSDIKPEKLEKMASNPNDITELVFDLFFDEEFGGNVKIDKVKTQRKPPAPL